MKEVSVKLWPAGITTVFGTLPTCEEEDESVTVTLEVTLTGFPKMSTAWTIMLDWSLESGKTTLGVRIRLRAEGIPPTLRVVTASVAIWYPLAKAVIVVLPGVVVVVKFAVMNKLPEGKLMLEGTVPIWGLDDDS